MKALFLMLFLVTACATSTSKTTMNKNTSLRPHEEFLLPNGLKVILMEDAVLPYFSLNLLIPSGSALDPAGKEGTSFVLANLLDKGTKGKSAAQIADLFANLGSQFQVVTEADFTTFHSGSLSFYSEDLVKAFSEIIFSAKISTNEMNKFVQRASASLSKLPDDPDGFADHAFNNVIYKATAYERADLKSLKSLEGLKLSDIQNFYQKFYKMDGATLAVVGKLPANVKELISKYFVQSQEPQKEVQNLNTQNSANQPVASAANEASIESGGPVAKPKIILVHKPGMVQAQIRFGHLSMPRNHPQYLPFRISQSILGQGFDSRLVDEIRVRRGLTYSIHSELSVKKSLGDFSISTFTRNEKVVETISTTLSVVSDYLKGASEEEMNTAKGALLGSFPRAIETAEKYAMNLQLLYLYGLDESYLTNFVSNVKKISLPEVRDVTVKQIHPEQLQIIIYGDKEQLLEKLQSLGPVEVKEFSDFL